MACNGVIFPCFPYSYRNKHLANQISIFKMLFYLSQGNLLKKNLSKKLYLVTFQHQMAKQVSLPEEGAVDRQEGKSQGMARNGGGILLKTRSSTSGWVLLLVLVRVGFS